MPSDSGLSEASGILGRAQVAAQAYGAYDVDQVRRIVDAVADEALRHGDRLARDAARETGFGSPEDKVVKNRAAVDGFRDTYRHQDYCSHRTDSSTKTLIVPRPAGVILAITPSTSPVACVYFKVLCALITRNAVVISPHPAAKRTCAEAARLLARAAERAGAPADVVQVVDEPTIPVVEGMMADERTRLVLATGGGAVVRAAYRSGTPAIGVGPGNPPVVVDETADLDRAAAALVASKSFDNSVLCTAESVLFVVREVSSRLIERLQHNDAYLCTGEQVNALRRLMYPGGEFNAKVVGRSAAELAQMAGFDVSTHAKVLLTPIAHVDAGESLTHEKLCPVLAVRTVTDFNTALVEARALLDVVGIGHSAVMHSSDTQRILDLSVALPVHRIAVNVPGAQGNAGIGTGLPITMSVGTGFVGGSSTGDNLAPDHLVQWSRTAYSADPAVTMPDFSRLQPRRSLDVTRSAYHTGGAGGGGLDAVSREDVRRMILEELQSLVGAR